MKLNLNKLLVISGTIAFICAIAFVVWWNKDGIVISKNDDDINAKEGVTSSISGVACENAKERPIAVMMAGDHEAKPLSGISQADMVFEMPVAPNGITRFMAVYQCGNPREIGSIRSARNDFIPLASGLNAIYAHWGGERDALEKLDNKILDNVDALKYEGSTYYRKRGAKPPHNGFTSLELLRGKAKELSYNLDDKFEGYPRADKIDSRSLANLAAYLDVGYKEEPFNSVWRYDSEKGVYKRARNNKPELDKIDGEQVSASVVIVMETTSSFIRDQYIKVDVQGQGSVKIYQGGVMISGQWKKDPSNLGSKLYFLDEKGQELKLLPGKIWIEIVTK